MNRQAWHLGALLLTLSAFGCRSGANAEKEPPKNASITEGGGAAGTAVAMAKLGTDPGGIFGGGNGQGTPLKAKPGHELAAFAAGCFWGVEDAFRHVQGVTATSVGYTGGHTRDPDYEKVCAHDTGHAETVLIEFDPSQVSYARLVNIFFQMHDPTTKNRQGPDVGDQYRSAVFTFSDAQAAAYKVERERAQPQNEKPIVTEVVPMGAFYAAESYHQQYTERTGVHGCPIHTFK